MPESNRSGLGGEPDPAIGGQGSADIDASRDPALRWARSGLMALTGPADGPPVVPEFDAMAGIEALFAQLEASAARCGLRLRGDLRGLTERAALQGLTRRGAVSCNGSCRLIAARDGWIAVNLPRAADLECVPAFVGASADEEPWPAVETRARMMSCAELVETGRLLGLAVSEARVPQGDRGVAPWSGEVTPLLRFGDAQSTTGRDWTIDPPLVVDLTALWAGPLCGQLLAAAGARVIKVESRGRPDPVRESLPAMFSLLNGGKESVVLDFTRASDLERLRALIGRADLVIGSARPRAFEQLGLVPEALIARQPGLTWVAITAHGWCGESRNAVGFGDDAAAAGGLLARDAAGRPQFMGDALADPLTGIAAAAGAFTALAEGGGLLVDAALSRTAAFVAAGRHLDAAELGQVERREGEWWLRVEGRAERVALPAARPVAAPARDLGADTPRVLAESAAMSHHGPGVA